MIWIDLSNYLEMDAGDIVFLIRCLESEDMD